MQQIGPLTGGPDEGAGPCVLMVVMGKVERIEQEVQALSAEELAEFRAWFLGFDWTAWDRQIERDISAGRLDPLAEQAFRDHTARKTKPL